MTTCNRSRFMRALGAAFVPALLPCTAFGQAPNSQPSSIDSVIAMVEAGLPDDVIISQLQKQGNVFDLSADDLVRLKKAKASDAILRAMTSPGSRSSGSPGGPMAANGVPGQAEPEIVGVPLVIDASGKFIDLERQNSNMGTKIKALGFGGGAVAVRYEGIRSPVRFPKDTPLRFAFRNAASGADPNTLLHLDRLTPQKDHRELTAAKVGAMGLGMKTTQGTGEIQLKATPLGNTSFQFTPSTPLAPGEYVLRVGVVNVNALAMGGGGYGYLFAID
jgi:hypothetical protein